MTFEVTLKGQFKVSLWWLIAHLWTQIGNNTWYLYFILMTIDLGWPWKVKSMSWQLLMIDSSAFGPYSPMVTLKHIWDTPHELSILVMTFDLECPWKVKSGSWQVLMLDNWIGTIWTYGYYWTLMGNTTWVSILVLTYMYTNNNNF